MKQIVMKSLKTNTITTIVLSIVCIMLMVLNVVQCVVHNKDMKDQVSFYTELMMEQQPDIQELPFKKLGKYSLSWYSPKELGKEKPQELKTSTGKIPKEGRTIAVDPNVIPYGSIVYIQDYGVFIAEDCGSAIKQNRIDIFTSNYDYAISMGKKVSNVWVLGKI